MRAIYFTGKPCKRGHISERYLDNKVCIECYKLYKKKVNKNPEYQTRQKEYRKKTDKLRIYGISNQQYSELFWKQNGACKLCEKPETYIHKKAGKVAALAIDHCHKTKEVRRLLCSKCNLAIGLLKHKPELLRKAAIYCEQSQ